jgi:hypothetical protein
MIVQRAGPTHFTEPDVGPFLRAVIEANEAVGLQRLAERDGLRVAEAAVTDGVVEPDVFDRTVLREELLQLRLLHRRVLADVGAQPAPAVAERGLDLALVEVLEIGADVAVGVLELRQVVVVEAALEGEAAGNVRQKRVNSN